MNALNSIEDSFLSDVRLIRQYGSRSVELLAPRQGEHILDIGCGDGELSAVLRKSGAVVTGVDIDPVAVERAKERGINAIIGDACCLEFTAEFDAVFSHAAIHWMGRPDRVFAGVFSALRSGGRFVAETAAHRNIAAIRTAIISSLCRFEANEDAIPKMYCPTADECCDLLESCGFTVTFIQAFARPTPLPSGINAYFDHLVSSYFDSLPRERRAAAKDYARQLLEPVLRTEDGDWIADYVHMRFAAVKREP